MKNKNLKTIKIGLVASLMILGVGSVFVNATYSNDSGDSNSISLASPVILSIDSPSDGSSFLEPAPLQTIYINIHVVNQFNYPVYDAWVHVYIGESQNFVWEGFTDSDGIVYWPRPNVDQDTTYRIKVEKFVNGNHQESTIYITIRNRCLKVSTNINPVDEGKEFYCIVKDQDNQPVLMATVRFNGKAKYTDVNGKTSLFKAPWVNKDTIYMIRASASLRGYDEGMSTVTIHNTNSPLTHKIYGQVRDYDFIPLKNVKITIIRGSYSHVTYTNNNGDYSIWITPEEGGEWVTIKASLSGYITQSIKKWLDGTSTDPIHVNFWFIQEDGNGDQNFQGQKFQGQQQQYQNQQ